MKRVKKVEWIDRKRNVQSIAWVGTKYLQFKILSQEFIPLRYTTNADMYYYRELSRKGILRKIFSV